MAALTLATAGAAGAATFIEPWTTSASGDFSAAIGDNGLGVAGGSPAGPSGSSTHSYDVATGMFTDTYSFVLPTGQAGASVITTLSGQAANDLTFTGISLNGAGGSTATGGGVSSAHVSFQDVVAGGEQELIITGQGGSAASFGGTVSFIQASDSEGSVGAVPEPAAWALLCMGFGAVGATLRQRRRADATSHRPLQSRS
ncbi:MAG: PEP-CTERM sorting domain-containing protein [Phenylobacterium sp.]|nr:MAG: PEP-CTERM sorting domain-containing protein [Phenylobacterium sp.]